MKYRIRCNRRQGSVLPLVAISLVAVCGFTALAVDIGLVVVAKTQCQNAADAAAMAGARSLDGSPSGNVTGATANAQSTARANKVLAQSIQNSDLTIVHGAYHYDPTAQTFTPQFPPVAPDNYNTTKVTVTRTVDTAFARVFNLTSLNVSATSIAAHRPRDCCIVLDYSGSMNNESDLWNNENYLGTANLSPNNTDAVFPQYGPYNLSFSPLATMQCTSTDPRVGKCNVTVGVLGIPALVNDFYQNARGGSAVPAFSPAPSPISNTTPGGDQPLNKNNTSTPALTWQDITGSSSNLFTGYAAHQAGKWNGYTQGPGYYGNTFFLWPPDPDPTKDWRKLYFFLSNGVTPLNDNTKLFAANGVLNDPPGNYVINYKAILNWIRTKCLQATPGDGKPFPSILRAGNILYYDQIPTDVPASAYDHTQPNTNITDSNQRFWKEYIDWTLGVWRDPYGNIQHPAHPACSYGDDFTAGTSTGGQYVQITGPDGSQSTWKAIVGSTTVNYINPTDNPRRPRHRFWFGPMTMVQFMSDTGLFPGTVHDISMYPAKIGIEGALLDIQNNHPNDLISMILFSRPQFTNDPPSTGQFNAVQYALCRDYTGMQNSLWFPPNTGSLDCRPWDSNGAQTPRAHADYNANTSTSYGFMLAYNQFSSNSGLRSILTGGQSAGGLGRKGSQRLVILETDGMANEDSLPASWFTNGGPNNSYYNILPGQTVNGGGFNETNLLQVVQAICNKADGTPGTAPGFSPNPAYPGFATPSKSVLIHTIAFGAIFEPSASGTEATRAVDLLQQISQIGGTVFPSSSSDPVNGYKWVIGTLSDRETKMRQAFSKIMDDGIAITLVK